MFELTEEQRKQLLAYMWSRPYGEVAQLVSIRTTMLPLKNKWDQSLNYIKKLLKNGVVFPLQGLKTLAYLVLLICWSTIIISTFLH